jgi:hypothetical protein
MEAQASYCFRICDIVYRTIELIITYLGKYASNQYR